MYDLIVFFNDLSLSASPNSVLDADPAATHVGAMVRLSEARRIYEQGHPIPICVRGGGGGSSIRDCSPIRTLVQCNCK